MLAPWQGRSGLRRHVASGSDPQEGASRAGRRTYAGWVITRSGTGLPCSTRIIVIEPLVVSPVGVNEKLPMTPFLTCVANSALVTDERVPSERAMASTSTSAACAP